MDTADRISDVMRRPGAYEIRNLEQAIAFFGGFDAATGFVLLDGFREWLSRNGGDGPNLTWAYQASRIVTGRFAEAERVGEFFKLVREFLATAR
ncbi:hypothetical protein [Amycolatopsis lexingtonensis]|uniref:hypothetical protein n=1 Tax=Amycolatopsis lexingtonensis TaxID=218822 RepID=UPI003F6E68BD